MFESKYAFYILTAFGATFVVLLLLALQSRLRLKSLDKQHQALKNQRGNRQSASFPPAQQNAGDNGETTS